MKSTKISILCFLLTVFSFTFAEAQAPFNAKALSYKIIPLFGVESVYRSTPTPNTATRVMYGVRLVVGYEQIAAEAEVTRGSDTQNFTVAPQKVVYTDDKLKLGVTGSYRLTSLFNVAGRLGGQAKKSTEESTSSGVTTTTEKPIEYSPYAGAAFGITLGPVRVSIGTTVVIKDINDMNKNEYQNTVAFSAGM
jgi:hypothetical protein